MYLIIGIADIFAQVFMQLLRWRRLEATGSLTAPGPFALATMTPVVTFTGASTATSAATGWRRTRPGASTQNSHFPTKFSCGKHHLSLLAMPLM